jgi:hypothetical protein
LFLYSIKTKNAARVPPPPPPLFVLVPLRLPCSGLGARAPGPARCAGLGLLRFVSSASRGRLRCSARLVRPPRSAAFMKRGRRARPLYMIGGAGAGVTTRSEVVVFLCTYAKKLLRRSARPGTQSPGWASFCFSAWRLFWFAPVLKPGNYTKKGNFVQSLAGDRDCRGERGQ